MNPLYLYPAEANLLKSGTRGEAYREAWRKLAEITHKQAGQEWGGKPGRLHTLTRVLAAVGIALASMYVLIEILLHVLPAAQGNAAGGTGMHIVFVLVIAVPAVACCIAHEQVKDRILKYYLDDYKPVCESYGEETLRQIGAVLRREKTTPTGNYVCLRCRRSSRYDETLHNRDEMYCPHCKGATLVGQLDGSLLDYCCNYQAELDARTGM